MVLLESDATTFTYRSDLAFYSAKVTFNKSAFDVNNSWSVIDHSFDRDIDNSDLRDRRHLENETWQARYLPTMKVTRVKDPIDVAPLGGGIYLPSVDYRVTSRFVVAYIDAIQKFSVEDHDPKCLRFSQCKTGISYDNEHFVIDQYNPSNNQPSGTQEQYIINAEKASSGSTLFTTDNAFNWGNKIDIGADMMHDYASYFYTNWSVHPIWHHFIADDQVASDPTVLKTNTANCIHVKALIQGFPDNIPDVSPHGAFFETTPNNFKWGDYGYFDFDDANRPASLTAKTPVSLSNYVQIENVKRGLVNTPGKDFVLDLNLFGSGVDYGMFYGLYYPEASEPKGGDLGSSNQRKSVMTSLSQNNISHFVYELHDQTHEGIYYSMSSGAGSNTTNFTVTPPFKLSSNASSNTKITRPSIAVYEQGDANGEFTGLAAIAVTWVEFQNALPNPGDPNSRVLSARVFMRTREFNSCSGVWGDWSPQYIVHMHNTQMPILNKYNNDNYDGAWANGSGGDWTTPVIAPLLTIDPTNIISTLLLGWSIVWSCPQLSATSQFDNAISTNSTTPRHDAIYCRTWLRNKSTPNAEWGIYPAIESGQYPSYLQPKNQTQQPEFPVYIWNVPLDAKSHPIQYPTIVNSENKKATTNGDLRIELAYSTDGTQGGIWYKQIALRNDPANPSTVGTLPTGFNSSSSTDISFGSGSNNLSFYSKYERKPCITMNSTGQTFVSWEEMGTVYQITNNLDGQFFNLINSSHIICNNTIFPAPSGTFWTSKTFGKGNFTNTVFNVPNIKTILSAPANTGEFKWLLNPSISGFPKTRVPNKTTTANDFDPGIVQIFSWQKNQYDPNSLTVSLVNKLQNVMTFIEGHGATMEGKGIWIPNAIQIPEMNGTNSQRSFGIYNSSPILLIPSILPSDRILEQTLNSSFAIGNPPASNSSFVYSQFGSFKGTYTHTLGMELYRSEDFSKDSAIANFSWGAVYVGDTTSALPLRQVILHQGIPDSATYTDVEAMHDSIFSTEVFDWYPGTSIKYWRGMTVDDSTILSSGAFQDSNFVLRYTFELVFENGSIDTIEQCTFSPAYGKVINSQTMHIVSGNVSARNVFLRVKRSEMGIHTILDTAWNLAVEFAQVAHLSETDSSITVYKRTTNENSIRSSGLLSVQSAYPNPLNNGSDNFHIGVQYVKDYPYSIEIRDILGRLLNQPMRFVSDGNWQQISLPKPSSPGNYFVRVLAGGETQVVAFTVMN